MRIRVGQRKCEMWISNNRVLIGGGAKKPHARNPNFETEETKLLISLWGDPKVQKTLITTHKKHPVISKLADAMRERGYHRSTEEINTRIKNLKCFYNRIKKDLEMGLIQEPTWRHYAAMDEILTRPVFGNRVQQPHLQNSQKGSDDDDSKDLRPEDLLSVEEDMDDDMDDMDDSIVPKEEPIDIDDMDDMIDEDDNEIRNANDIFPKLSAYLQLGSNSAMKGNGTNDANGANGEATATAPVIDIKTSPPGSPVPESDPASDEDKPSKSEPTVVKVTVASSVAGATATVVSATNATGANKISLVPTNMLMKTAQAVATSVAPTFGFKSSQYLCTKTTPGLSTITTTQNGVPMKVLLVNTLSKPNSTPTATIAPKPIISTRSLVSIQPKPTVISTNASHTVVQSTYQTRSTTAATAQAAQQPRPTLLSSNKYLCSGGTPVADTTQKRSSIFKQKPPLGFRTMFNQMVQLQQKQLEVSQQRLELERERLEFERKRGDKILEALTVLLQDRKQTKSESDDKATSSDIKDKCKKLAGEAAADDAAETK